MGRPGWADISASLVDSGYIDFVIAALHGAQQGSVAHICRSVPLLIRFIPDSLRGSAPLFFLKRQCDRTLGVHQEYQGRAGEAGMNVWTYCLWALTSLFGEASARIDAKVLATGLARA